VHSYSGRDTFTARGWSLFSLVVTMCSSIPLQHICVVQGVSSADVARDVGFGVVSTLPTGYTEQHTHFHSRRVRGFVFCGWGSVGGRGRFPLLTKVICLEQMWLRIPKRKKKKRRTASVHISLCSCLYLDSFCVWSERQKSWMHQNLGLKFKIHQHIMYNIAWDARNMGLVFCTRKLNYWAKIPDISSKQVQFWCWPADCWSCYSNYKSTQSN